MLTFLKSLSPVLVMISSISMLICNHLHARQANRFLEGYPSLTSACASLLELTGFGRGLLKSTFNAKNFVCKLFSFISSHFGAIYTWNACRSPKSRKIHYNPYFRGSRLFKVIDVDIPKKLVASACYNKRYCCAYLQPFPRYTSQYR